jgi:hypothetical protein
LPAINNASSAKTNFVTENQDHQKEHSQKATPQREFNHICSPSESTRLITTNTARGKSFKVNHNPEVQEATYSSSAIVLKLIQSCNY